MDEVERKIGEAWDQGHKAGRSDGWSEAIKLVSKPAFLAYLEGGDCPEARKFRELIQEMLRASTNPPAVAL